MVRRWLIKWALLVHAHTILSYFESPEATFIFRGLLLLHKVRKSACFQHERDSRRPPPGGALWRLARKHKGHECVTFILCVCINKQCANRWHSFHSVLHFERERERETDAPAFHFNKKILLSIIIFSKLAAVLCALFFVPHETNRLARTDQEGSCGEAKAKKWNEMK